MKALNVIIENGLTPETWSDICFERDNIIGTCRKETGDRHLYKAISITLEDNEINPDGDLDAMILSYETVKEIAYSCDILYTDFGLAVHSNSFKHAPFNTLEIKRLTA